MEKTFETVKEVKVLASEKASSYVIRAVVTYRDEGLLNADCRTERNSISTE